MFRARTGRDVKRDNPKGVTAQAGFTLIETVVAMLVMMVAALAAASLFVYAVSANTGGSERAMAMAVAQQQVEQLRSVTYDDATLSVGTTTLPVATIAGRRYAVTRTVSLETIPADNSSKNLKRITITVTPQNEARQWIRSQVSLTTHRSAPTLGQYAIP